MKDPRFRKVNACGRPVPVEFNCLTRFATGIRPLLFLSYLLRLACPDDLVCKGVRTVALTVLLVSDAYFSDMVCNWVHSLSLQVEFVCKAYMLWGK